MSAVDDLPWDDKEEPVTQVCSVCNGRKAITAVIREMEKERTVFVTCPNCWGRGVTGRTSDGE